MPFLDQRYQVWQMSQQFAKPAILVGPFGAAVPVAGESVIIVMGTTNLAEPISLPAITANNQGRGIYIFKYQAGVDATAVRIAAAGTDLIARDSGLAPASTFDISPNQGYLFVAKTAAQSIGAVVAGTGYWWPVLRDIRTP